MLRPTVNPSSKTPTIPSKMMSAEFVESQRQYAIALEAARSIRVRVWSVYRLDPYDEFGAQGTRFVFQHAKPTRDEAFESVSGPKPAFAVEENLAADGTRWYLTSSEDSRVHNGGPMNNANLLDGIPLKSAEGYVYDGKNPWVRAKVCRNGIERFSAEAIATEPKPMGWKEPKKTSARGIFISFHNFPGYGVDDYADSDEENEEDYDY